jgi:predicted protein tyrosine phosphatase
MNWIDETIEVGDLVDANNIQLLTKEDIEFIIDAMTLFKSVPLHPLQQEPRIDKILKAADLLIALSSLNAQVLIHCLMGVDRTPFLARVYISKKHGMPYKDAYSFVKKKRPQTVFHWDWVEQPERFPVKGDKKSNKN